MRKSGNLATEFTVHSLHYGELFCDEICEWLQADKDTTEDQILAAASDLYEASVGTTHSPATAMCTSPTYLSLHPLPPTRAPARVCVLHHPKLTPRYCIPEIWVYHRRHSRTLTTAKRLGMSGSEVSSGYSHCFTN